ncbi:hypothetical protein MNV49_003254 [Pseudohyphozyma bogoriensis]|nr:hypothetical protein MNV49_003254 [Pseudohyphozyma bogoriensis]
MSHRFPHLEAKKSKEDADVVVSSVSDSNEGDEDARYGSTSAAHRSLEGYHINLIAFGGAIGTAIFIYIGSGLTQAGPLSLLIGYTWWVAVIYCVAMCQMELIAFWPTDCAFSRNAGRYIDEAAGFALGWNFWANEVALVAFEVTSFTVVLEYWSSTLKVNVAVYISIVLAVYFVLNIWSTRYFGNAEFAFAIGKILLITGLLCFTFIAMLGGNPIHDRFGFRYWRDPGVMTTPYPDHPHGVGLFEGFLAAVTNAAFTIAVVAGEARNPRKSMPAAFRKTIYRLVVFFIGGALAVGVLVPYNSANLLNAIGSGAPGAAKSPYVIAMNRLKVKALPSIVNALILSSIFSAGNAYYFGGSRALAQLARDGHAPKIFALRNRNGVPWVAVIVSCLLSLLSYCQVSSSAQVAITWLSGIVTACQLLNWVMFAFTWIKWNWAIKAQGIDRATLPATSIIMPYGAWFAFISGVFVLLMQGYYVFLKGGWNVDNFIFSYLAPIVFVALFIGWKLIKRTTWYRSSDVDLVSFINDPSFDDYVYEDEERGKFGKAVHVTLSKLF